MQLLVPRGLPNLLLKTYGQYGEDAVIDVLFAHKRGGFYIDIGANDPDIFSNTKLFYNRGWCGINIEPEPKLHAKLCRKRDRDINMNIGVGPDPGVMPFYRMSADTLSSFNKEAAIQSGKLHGATLVSEEPIQVMRLADIFELHLKGRTIDFMSVDAEGYDLDILKSNDWSRYRPSLIIVEINIGGDEIVNFLQQHDYLLVFGNGTNGIFITKEFSDSIGDSVREDLTILDQNYGLRTAIPQAGSGSKLTINIVYGHMAQTDIHTVHKGNISIIWSHLPIEGCDHYAYHNSFSYRGKRPGLNILIMLEPAVVLPGEFDGQVWKHFDHVLALFDALAGQGNKFHKILFPRFDGSSKAPVTEPADQRELLYPLSGRKNAICMISGNKRSHVPGELYSKRIEVAEWFHKNSVIPFDVYGRPPFTLPNYRGAIPEDQKLAVLKQYRYSLCFENTNHPVFSAGYITEKILDCLESRTVPVYSGASNIEKYIPKECFIDFRRFSGLEELDYYLRNMPYKEYEQYVEAIDTWVSSGKLRDYSNQPMYDLLADLCAAASSMSLETLFAGEKTWTKGKAVPPTAGSWKFIDSPVMWTWKHLSKADPPVLKNEKSLNGVPESKDTGSIETTIPNHKSFLIGRKPLIKVLFAGRKFSNGSAARGYDYCWWNLYHALQHFENLQVQFFDFATEAQQRGVAGMSDRLTDIVHRENPDLLLYTPFDYKTDVLYDSMRSITDLTDTQTIIWIDYDQYTFENYGQLWGRCADYIVITSNEAVSKYQRAGLGHKVIKSQWAFNPFTYNSLTFPRTRDVSFVGLENGNRSEVIGNMRQKGLAVETFGFGWPASMDIPLQDMVRIFNQTKVNLNIGESFSAVQQIKRRNFEVPGCRGFLLTTPAEGIQEYYEPDKEVVIASSLEELLDKSRYYLVHEREREIIAQRGYERTLAEHTWTHRLKDVLQCVGLPAIAKPIPQNSPSPFLQAEASSSKAGLLSTDTARKAADPDDQENIMVSINVTAFNQLHYTKLCVGSILHHTTGTYQLILTDNGSTDGTFEYFESVKLFHPDTIVIKNYQNRFPEAVGNYAYSLSIGKYIVCVTNDTMVHEGWLENMIRQIESAPEIGMAGPRSNNVSGPQAVQANYDSLEAYQTFATDWSYKHRGLNSPIDRIVGFFFIIKKEIFERIGGMDPDLPTNGKDGGYGFSDDDFTMRFRLAGYKSIIANDVFIHHFGSVTAIKYRPDLFGPAQNINKEKFIQKLLKNDRISIGKNGELTLRPYNPNDIIPVAENTVIRPPRICIVLRNAAVPESADYLNHCGFPPDFIQGETISLEGDFILPWLSGVITKGEYDYIVVINKKPAPLNEQICELIYTALCYPDVAIMVPIGNYAPSTHSQQTENGKRVEVIQYADLSFSVLNVKLFRSCTRGLAYSKNEEDLFWFLQRRVRGEGYYIAKTNNVVINTDVPCRNHPYDRYVLPETLMSKKQYAEAISIYNDDLRKDPAFVESTYQLACIAKEQHQLDKAIQYAENALRIDPHHIQPLILLSRIFLDQDDIRRAEEVVRLAKLKQPGNPDVQKIVARYEQLISRSDGSSIIKSGGTENKSKETKGLTSIIIRVSPDLGLVEKCLQSIRKHTHVPFEIIFIVQETSPLTVKWAKEKVRENKNYRYIVNAGDLDLDQENNQGIHEATGEFILLLNEDVVVTENWLSGMLESMNGVADKGRGKSYIFKVSLQDMK